MSYTWISSDLAKILGPIVSSLKLTEPFSRKCMKFPKIQINYVCALIKTIRHFDTSSKIYNYSKTSWDTVKCPKNIQCIKKQCISRYTGWPICSGTGKSGYCVAGTVRIQFKKLLNKKEIRFKKEFLVTKMQFTVIHDSK